MTRLRVFLFRLRALGRSRQIDRELEDEISSHLAEATDDYIRQGLSPEEARRAAQRRFGGVTQAREVYREVGSFMWLEDLWRDLRHALRALAQESGVYDGRRGHSDARDWRQHRDVQRSEWRAAAAPSLSRPGTAGDVVDGGSDAEPPRGPIGAVGCRTVADVKVRASQTWPPSIPWHAADGSRRSGTNRRRQRFPQHPFRCSVCNLPWGAAFRTRTPSKGNASSSSVIASGRRDSAARAMRSARRSC